MQHIIATPAKENTPLLNIRKLAGPGPGNLVFSRSNRAGKFATLIKEEPLKVESKLEK